MKKITAAQYEILEWAASGKSVGHHKWTVVRALYRRGMLAKWVKVQWGYRLELTSVGQAALKEHDSTFRPDLSKDRPWVCECGNGYRKKDELTTHQKNK